jgi:hypothetical protein
MNISEVFTAGKKAVERHIGKIDIAAAAEILAVGGMGTDFEAAGEDRCGSSERAICATLFCS